jgi:hypothetical protein
MDRRLLLAAAHAQGAALCADMQRLAPGLDAALDAVARVRSNYTSADEEHAFSVGFDLHASIPFYT